MSLNKLYDSENFIVCAMDITPDNQPVPPVPNIGYELVDKRTHKEIMLTGEWAHYFQAQISRWQNSTPEQGEVEAVLDSYCQLAQNPLIMH